VNFLFFSSFGAKSWGQLRSERTAITTLPLFQLLQAGLFP